MTVRLSLTKRYHNEIRIKCQRGIRMKCRQCGHTDRFRTKFKKIRQNLMICTVCGYIQIKGLHKEDNDVKHEKPEVKG